MKVGASTLCALMLMIMAVCGGAAADSEPNTPWGGDFFPNIPLVAQDGRQVRFFDDLIKDKVVAINFIFTSCTDSCPLETARLRQVQQQLGDRVGRDVFFYSISIDPETDTPEVMKKYAEKFKVAPGWLFLTGKKDDITELRQKLGLFIEGVDNGRTKDHNLSLIVGNQATGRWMKASPFENPYILADQLGNSLQNWKHASANQNNYADAPEIRTPSLGEQIFRTRCSSCHTLGMEEGVATPIRSIGPDLLGVTRARDPLWLGRWLREPDKMLEEKEPLAMQLFSQYNQVAMPNLRLADNDITAVLAYLEAESDRQQPKAVEQAAAEHAAHVHRMDHMDHTQ
ncbi:SCO family protein [Pseudomonas akapageensis]|uniref:SCO family protein n=1 Tax=Pseudomonas akapageensis TaxID=2609961 RepID=UPI001408FBFE|nr:SCO family protein [Pseudomonas akapageensis]